MKKTERYEITASSPKQLIEELSRIPETATLVNIAQNNEDLTSPYPLEVVLTYQQEVLQTDQGVYRVRRQGRYVTRFSEGLTHQQASVKLFENAAEDDESILEYSSKNDGTWRTISRWKWTGTVWRRLT